MNYSIEGNIDFYKELFETICESESNILENKKQKKEDNTQENINKDTYKNEKKCLITHLPLQSPMITLDCNHKFNYIPLFKEITRQKTSDYSEKRKLRVNQIKCPYCRQIQNKLLPYIPSLKGSKLIIGVTSPQKYSMYSQKCESIIKSGKRKGEKCGKKCEYPNTICNMHKKYEQNKTINVNVKKTSKEANGKCCAILKYGKRKGLPCNCNVFKDGKCKRHSSTN